ncbi:hypothetical protein ACFFX0_06385 [Citricoccus parietis]|uniref:Uncharacterized protein n=1 Tax=Citricoccus parietis TaxID=592307 RepID=A0ABV5FVZ8_9MICC
MSRGSTLPIGSIAPIGGLVSGRCPELIADPDRRALPSPVWNHDQEGSSESEGRGRAVPGCASQVTPAHPCAGHAVHRRPTRP